MTAPLTPPDSDLQDYPFMPLHVARLRDSDLAAEEGPEACWYAVLLWAVSWHQLPAGSLPNSDAVITKLIGLGRDIKTFSKHKAGALRGFILCDDGRLYHPVVAEQVITGWRGKLEQRWRTECARIKKRNQRDKTDHPLPTFAQFHATLPETSRLRNVFRDRSVSPEGQTEMSMGTSTACPRGNGIQEKGKGIETGISNSVPNGTGAEAPPANKLDPLASLRELDAKTGAWRLAIQVLMDRGGYPEARARPIVGKWAKSYASVELWQAAESALSVGTLDPVSYITAALARISADNADPLRSPSELRQRAWMEDFLADPVAWREHERGPRPGAIGCRVSPEIQREFTPPIRLSA
jgi:hypothetical protein